MATRTYEPGSKEAKPFEDLETANKQKPKPLERIRKSKGKAAAKTTEQEK